MAGHRRFIADGESKRLSVRSTAIFLQPESKMARSAEQDVVYTIFVQHGLAPRAAPSVAAPMG